MSEMCEKEKAWENDPLNQLRRATEELSTLRERERRLVEALEDAIRRFAQISSQLKTHTGAKQRAEIVSYAEACKNSARAILKELEGE